MQGEIKAWVVAVSMGYGHQRTAFPLRHFASGGKIINANNYEGIPEKDKRIWESSRRFYEFISNFKRFPIIGNSAFDFYDRFQRILNFYPKRDLSRPTISLRKIFSFVDRGWGRDLIDRLRKDPIPFITTFFTPAFMAEVWKYPGEIFCIICDADISRAWAPLNPGTSKIKYCAPNSWVVNRLKLYGVKEENIFLTGYPLPLENIGSEQMEVVKEDLRYRLVNLDPRREHYIHYRPLIEESFGFLPEHSDHLLTLMFSVGGAGAQSDIALQALRALTAKIKNKEIKMIISAGIKKEVRDYFAQQIDTLGLRECLDSSLEILSAETIEQYFTAFNAKLRKTDILWTKPSELSFYSGLGIPLIIAPSIGSQEDFNRKWLLGAGAGIAQEDPRYADQWIFDYLQSGKFAELATRGFLEVEKLGVYHIGRICFRGNP